MPEERGPTATWFSHEQLRSYEQLRRPTTEDINWSSAWTNLASHEAVSELLELCTPSPAYTFLTPYYMWKGKKIYISLAKGNSNYVLRGTPPIFIDRKTEGQEGVVVLSLAQKPVTNRSYYHTRRIVTNLYVPVFRYGDNIDNEEYRVYRNRLNTFIRNSFRAFDRRYKSLVPVLKDINSLYLGDR